MTEEKPTGLLTGTSQFDDFLKWEATTRDIIDFKKIYVDVADDLIAGLLLSEIVYWYLPDKAGKSKLRVNKEAKYWIAAKRYDWWERARITPRQFDSAVTKLEKLGIIETKNFRFDGLRTVHLRIIEDNFLLILKKFVDTPAVNPHLPVLQNGETEITDQENPRSNESVTSVSPNGDFGLAKSVRPLTETTTENTTETTSLNKTNKIPIENREKSIGNFASNGNDGRSDSAHPISLGSYSSAPPPAPSPEKSKIRKKSFPFDGKRYKYLRGRGVIGLERRHFMLTFAYETSSGFHNRLKTEPGLGQTSQTRVSRLSAGD